MSGTECCASLRQARSIRRPGELTETIQLLRASVLSRVLGDVTPKYHSPSGPFAELLDEGPWPDYIENYFKCLICGHRFRFAVDTYHGGGGELDGEWEPY